MDLMSFVPKKAPYKWWIAKFQRKILIYFPSIARSQHVHLMSIQFTKIVVNVPIAILLCVQHGVHQTCSAADMIKYIVMIVLFDVDSIVLNNVQFLLLVVFFVFFDNKNVDIFSVGWIVIVFFFFWRYFGSWICWWWS